MGRKVTIFFIGWLSAVFSYGQLIQDAQLEAEICEELICTPEELDEAKLLELTLQEFWKLKMLAI